MEKALKISGIILGSLIGIIIIIILVFSAGKGMTAKELYAQLGEKAPVKCLQMCFLGKGNPWANCLMIQKIHSTPLDMDFRFRNIPACLLVLPLLPARL